MFKIGEIVLFQNARLFTILNNLECKIIEAYAYRKYNYPKLTGETYGWCWIVEFPDYGQYAAEAGQLRKRRPPQDWSRICNLGSLRIQNAKTSISL